MSVLVLNQVQPNNTCLNDSSCKTIYCPDRDIQRHCPTCHRWFHVQCLSHHEAPPPFSITGQKSPPDGLSEECRALCIAPIERGQGNHDIVGNGRLQTDLRNLLPTVDPASWRGLAGRTYINLILSQNSNYFFCPLCNTCI